MEIVVGKQPISPNAATPTNGNCVTPITMRKIPIFTSIPSCCKTQ